MELLFMLYYKKCVVEYDGSGFFGWQVQKNGRTVQEEIEKGLSVMYKNEVKVVGSGRTDAGVNAAGQVFSYRMEKYLENKAVHFGLNSLLPDDIAIISVEDAPDKFNAQTWAKSKTYRYTILNRRYPSALMAKRCWWLKGELDLNMLVKFAQVFTGTHDFASFCIKGSLKEDTVRTVNYINVSQDNDFINIEINGNGFLHMMVRLIVGTLVDACQKGRDENYLKKVLEAKTVEEAGYAAPAHGLMLYSVEY